MSEVASQTAGNPDSDRVLVVDDEPHMLANCRRILEQRGYRCCTAGGVQDAFTSLETQRIDLLITDQRLPDGDGMNILGRSRALDALRPVIIITGFGTIEAAVAAVKAGAFEYLTKPFSADQLRLATRRALTQRHLALENRNLRDQLTRYYGFDQLVGKSPQFVAVLEMVRKSARSEADVLILGESGTGKELVARAIHANSRRAAQPFVAIDCAALPETLLESELFGYERGAFTGASGNKPGLMELADRGTLFLDEIGELAHSLQAKLLRVLQERRLRRLGGRHEIELDVRVIAATNRDLRTMTANGGFREDLFYRINVIDVVLPPLRERPGDVKLLAYSLLARGAAGRERVIKGFDPEVIRIFENHSWPGNVRELQNVVERGCALTEHEVIQREDLPGYLQKQGFAQGTEDPAAESWPTLKGARQRWLDDLEAAYLRAVLEKESGNLSRAARTAGVDRKTLYRTLRRLKVAHEPGGKPREPKP